MCLVASDTSKKQTAANFVTECRICDLRRQRIRSSAVKAHCDVVVTFLQVRLELITQPKVNCEIGLQPQIIMDITRIVPGKEPNWGRYEDAATFGITQKQAGNRIPGVGLRTLRIPLCESPSYRKGSSAAVAVREIDRDLTIRTAEFEAVTANELRITADEIVGLPEDRIIGCVVQRVPGQQA